MYLHWYGIAVDEKKYKPRIEKIGRNVIQQKTLISQKSINYYT